MRERKTAWLSLALTLSVLMTIAARPAFALDAVVLTPDADHIDITSKGDLYEGKGDMLQPETATGPDNVSGRMSVKAVTPGTSPNWVVFALTNPSNEAVERWLTAERYTVVGSGAVWPDLDRGRIEQVTPSVGYMPVRIPNDRADIFSITVEPGKTVTFVAELSSERFPTLSLWKPVDYELKVRDRQLFNGILLGLTGLLAIFLTVIFAANHKIIFPAAALVAWCVLGLLCVDFGFFHKLFQLKGEDNAVYRAALEAATAASLAIFLYVFLRLGTTGNLVRMLLGVWILAQLALIPIAVVDPRLSATFARLSFLLIGGAGALFIGYLALRWQDRALSLVPTWILFLVWIFGVAVTLLGRLSGEIIVSGLVAGLVLVVLLIGFTVTQFAFRAVDGRYGADPDEGELRAIALEGAGCAVWEWNGRRDEVKVGRNLEAALGLGTGDLNRRVDEFTRYMHEADRERFRLMLWSIQEREGGKIRVDFRMRHADSSIRWFELEASSVPDPDRRSVRCVGICRDITDAKRAQDRLLQDAVHDSLTGLPNRALLVDRLAVAMRRAKTENAPRPTILYIDIDRFKSINASLGPVIGDSLLLTTARRLQRHLGACDTLARLGGDQFAMLLTAEQQANTLASLAERVRRSLRAPIKIAGHDVVLTGSLGIAIYDGETDSPGDFVKDAEVAMYRAKRQGADRIEIFRPEMRGERDDRSAVEAELIGALERNALRVLYQPIVYLPTEEPIGFEAVLRWEHPRLGFVDPESLLQEGGPPELAVKLGAFTLVRAAQEASRWHKELPRAEAPVFVSVRIANRHFFRQDLVQEVRHIVGREALPKASLRLALPEQLVMENPEQSSELLDLLHAAGVDLVLDSFGSGYCSLAYVQKLPFDAIKIDRPVVESGKRGDAGDASVLRSMTALVRELGRKSVAEGVGSEEDARFLRSVGCDFGQGTFYGDPMGEREVLQLLKALRRADRKAQSRGFLRTTAKKRNVVKRKQPATPRLAGKPRPAFNGMAPAAVGGQPASPAAGKPAFRPRPRAPMPGTGTAPVAGNGSMARSPSLTGPPRGILPRMRGTPPGPVAGPPRTPYPPPAHPQGEAAPLSPPAAALPRPPVNAEPARPPQARDPARTALSPGIAESLARLAGTPLPPDLNVAGTPAPRPAGDNVPGPAERPRPIGRK